MTRKKVDRKIIELIQRSIISRHRCMFFVCGTKAKDQVPFLHHLLLQCRRESSLEKPSVLWCFKKEAGLSGQHQRKRLKQLRKKYSGSNAVCEEDIFDHFLLSASPHFCHYSESERVLGRSFALLVAQDFEALTPNTLARITECVEGTGAIVFLLPFELQHLFQLKMDAHTRYVTESHSEVVPLFNRRLVHSLATCSSCLVLDDSLQVRMLPSNFDAAGAASSPVPFFCREPPVFSLCRTHDQLAALRCLRGALDTATSSVVSLSAGRGRGKSAVLGLAVALAVKCGLSNILLTSPHPENLHTLFAFIVKGLEAIGFKEGPDFRVVWKDACLATSVCISRGKKLQLVKYLPPTDPSAAGSADLLVVDEAAAIPLPLVKEWVLPGRTVFMASTVQGYEGTGRSLSLKLLNQLRNPSKNSSGHVLHEVLLNEAIRYSNGDPIEAWLERLLCLEASADDIFPDRALPLARNCQLYHVNRGALFGGGALEESFLQQLVSLFVASHYKNSPNDLMMAADAPAHRLYCLLDSAAHPTPLCAIQVSLEGGLSTETSRCEQEKGRRGAGDLIPWIVSQQFQDKDFPSLSSARVVRIATHPRCQRMGYGRRALDLLFDFYSTPESCGRVAASRNVLLSRPEEQGREPLDYLGVSFGLTSELLKFWTRAGFVPLYIRQTTSDVTGEHSCVMARPLCSSAPWLQDFSADFRVRFAALLPTAFRRLPSPTTMEVLRAGCKEDDNKVPFLCSRSLLRLGAYCCGEVDFHLVLDLMPRLVPLLHHLNHIQGCVLSSVGLQGKSVEQAAEELHLDPPRVLGLFRRAVARMLAPLQQGAFHDEEHSTPSTAEGKRPNEEILHNKFKKFKRSKEACD